MKYAELIKHYGTGKCLSNCQRQVKMTDKGPVIVCDFCKRVVMKPKE